MKLYSTVAGAGEAEQIIEKSRFITHVMPVNSKEEADDFIAAIKKEYKDATHNVPAMVLGEKMQVQWGSDDGEPQGTSGAPVVQMLVREGITNVALVVTRYFGGIKLGTGGLVRAYTSSAKLGLEAAGIADVKEMSVITYKVDYSTFNRIQNFIFDEEVSILNEVYGSDVQFEMVTDPAFAEDVKEAVTGLSNGQAVIVSEEVKEALTRRGE